MIHLNKSNLPFFYGILSRIDGDTYYVTGVNTDDATYVEMPVKLSSAYEHSDKPRPEPGEYVKCYIVDNQTFIVAPTPYPATLGVST